MQHERQRLQKERASGGLKFGLQPHSVSALQHELEPRLYTFHCHWYSSTIGGLVLFFGPSPDSPPFSPSSPVPHPLLPSATCWFEILPSGTSLSTAISSSNWSNSNFDEGSPNLLTAGNPVRSDLSFNVNRGPISCNAAFSVDRKAYLKARE